MATAASTTRLPVPRSARLPRPFAPLVLCALATALPAQTTVNVPCARDNTLYQSATGALSNGAGPSVFVGTTNQTGIRRALLRFDVAAAVPAGARILSAALTIQVAQSTFAGTLDVAGHRVLQDWGEGTSNPVGNGGGGAPATPGDATWLHTFSPAGFWANAGGDYAAAPSFTIVTPPLGSATSGVSAAMLADVQGWLDNPAQNFGWLLKTSEVLTAASRRIDSRENLVGTPPVLSIRYLLRGQTAPLGVGCPVGGQPFTHGVLGAPIGGTTVQLTQGNGPPNSVAVNLVSLSFDPVGFPLLPQCSLHLPFGGLIVTFNILVLDNVGNGATPLSIAPGYPGLLLVTQSAAIDNSPSGYVLSNARLLLLQ